MRRRAQPTADGQERERTGKLVESMFRLKREQARQTFERAIRPLRRQRRLRP